MKRRIVDWSVAKLIEQRPQITFPEYQREKSLWTSDRKALLIDSILQDIDIPKIYMNRVSKTSLEIVDGQQRLWSIWEFADGEVRLQSDGYKGKTFNDLTPAEKKKFGEYTLQITEFEDAEEDYLRELFKRLQLGLLLNAGEKLHASRGKMKDFIFGKTHKAQFVERLGIPKRRFAKETLCAQFVINAFSRAKLNSFSRTRYDDLEYFFQEYENPTGKDLVKFNEITDIVSDVLDTANDIFGKSADKLRNRSYILSILLFLQSPSVPQTKQKKFEVFIFELWRRLREEAGLGLKRKNSELYAFQSKLSSAPGEAYQIEGRHEKLVEYFDYFVTHSKIKGD